MGKKYIIQWHITHKCNLRCSHCYQEEYYNHMPMDLVESSLEKISSFLSDKYINCQINITGGEPLVHPSFLEICRKIKSKGFYFSVLTNGTLITESMAEELSKLRPIFVQVSLDGVEKTHDKIRGIGSYNKALKGIELLKKNGIRVLVSFTAQRENIKDYKKLVRVCSKYSVDKIWWDRVVIPSKEDINKISLTTKEFKKMVEQTSRLKKIYRLMGKSIEISNSRSLQFCNDKTIGYKCSVGENLLVLLANGDIMACRRLPFVLGNIQDGTIEEILKKSEIYNRLKCLEVSKDCKDCKYLNQCFGGSKCVSYAKEGKLDIKDVNCFYK